MRKFSPDVVDAMQALAESLRAAARAVRDGYYDDDDDAQRAANHARRETLDDVAGAIETAFPEPR